GVELASLTCSVTCRGNNAAPQGGANGAREGLERGRQAGDETAASLGSGSLHRARERGCRGVGASRKNLRHCVRQLLEHRRGLSSKAAKFVSGPSESTLEIRIIVRRL